MGTRSSIHVNLYVPTLIGGIGKSYLTQPAVILIRYSAQKQHTCFLLSVTGLLITIVGVWNEKVSYTPSAPAAPDGASASGVDDPRVPVSGVAIHQNMNNMNCSYLITAKHTVSKPGIDYQLYVWSKYPDSQTDGVCGSHYKGSLIVGATFSAHYRAWALRPPYD